MTTTTLTTSNIATMTESNSTLEIPSYISSRSANSLISFSRPTRIQAITLEALNRILDELLLLILSSAKSLATDRIKSDGILRVLGGQSGSGSGAGALLAKNAVLEAELELRSYLDGQRKEGGKMPLGLSATSRWDGTEGFPVQSAYKALRIRCQYYSTLGELEDPSPNSPQEQNIMSSDGRPIATITPGVAIYVTALLEFVAEYILQNVARVIERDNSDEATLNDLIKAMEEDEGTLFWWNKMQSRKFIQNLDKENKSGGIGKGKVQKPWQVPDADEYDQAAGKKKFQRQSMTSITPSHSSSSNNNILNNSTNSRTAIHDRTSSSGHNDVRNGASESPTLSHQTHTTGITSIPSGSTESNTLKRRTSFDKRGLFGRRRGSFRSSQDLGLAGLGVSGTGLPSNNGRDSNISQSADDNYNAVEGDDFDSLVMSGQTMKVSLTPNRLRSMDVSADGSQDSESAKRSARKRPGTGNLLRAETPNTLSTREGTSEDQVPPRPGSRTGSVIRPSSSRGHGKAAPPSAYRGPEGENRAPDHLESSLTDEAEIATGRNKALPIHTPSPPSPGTGSFAQNGRESRMSLVSQTSTDTQSKRMTLSGAGGKVLGFFGRRSTTSNSSISPSTSANVSVDPSLQRTHTGSTFRSVKGIQRPNGGSGGVGVEENYNDSRSATPSVAHETRKENRESISATSIVAMEREPSDHARISPELQRMNGKIQEERRESSTGHEEPLSNDDSPNVNEPPQTTSGGIVGLYSEPKANASASTLSSVHNRDSTSRKVVPWSYRRRSSGPIINAANRVGSGAGSSTGHGVGGGESGAPPSAWSQNNFDTTGSGNHANNAGNTPTIGVSPSFGGRTSPSPRPFSMGNSKTDVARLLVQLNQRMRECNNVEECQKLVMQALALTAAAVHTENDPSGTSTANPPQSANSDALPLSTVQPPQKEEEEVELQTNKSQMKELDLLHSVPQYRSVNYRNLALPMSVGYNPTEDDNLPSFQEQGLIASWLLGNEGEEPEVFEAIKQQNEKSFTPLPRRQSLSVNNRRSSKSSFYTKNRSSRQNSVSSIGQESDFASADERPQSELKNSSSLLTTAIENNTNQNNKSNSTTNSNKSPQFFTPNPQQSEIGFVDENDQHRISLAGSVNSNYRDATEEAVNDVD